MIKALALAGVALAVAACSGQADPVARFAGAWQSNCYADADNSIYHHRDATTISETSGVVLTYTGSLSTYASGDCSGAAVDVADYAGTIRITGSMPIGSVTAYTAQMTPEDQEPGQNILALSAGKLVFGKKGSPLDADGYQTVLDGDEQLSPVR